jgi:hypothetical protein
MGRDGTEAEWLEMRGILAHQIEYFETGNQVTPIDQDPAKATAVWLGFLRRHLEEHDAFLAEYRPDE